MKRVWVKSDEEKSQVQKETIIKSENEKTVNSVGRSPQCDIPVPLDAVSTNHCAIAYDPKKGWTISEKGKENASSNGTFVFLKTLKQKYYHMPSDLIPLHDGMVLSFVNYELRVSFENKSGYEFTAQKNAA